ncbi:MAG TPA: zinc-binding alcohol dehydrogenase [Chthoniobacterales bacterium]|nr:zinc-binding alcohol dehydrogenase [Chthoniobacterales bacterium]
MPGYSAVGRIVRVGEGVEAYAPNDRVIWAGRHESHTIMNVGNTTNGVAAPIWRISETVQTPVAACAVLARFPLTALARSSQILGQSVAVFGLGLIGQITLRLFSSAGAYPLIGIEPQVHRRHIAESTAGVTTVDPTTGDLRPTLRAINNGALPDIVVDATGVPDVVRTAMSIVTDGGHVIMVGSPRGIAGDVDFYWDLHGRSIALIGAHGSAIGDLPREKFPFVRDRAFRLIVHLLETGKLRIDDLISHHVNADQAPMMYDGLHHHGDEFLGVTLHW